MRSAAPLRGSVPAALPPDTVPLFPRSSGRTLRSVPSSPPPSSAAARSPFVALRSPLPPATLPPDRHHTPSAAPPSVWPTLVHSSLASSGLPPVPHVPGLLPGPP